MKYKGGRMPLFLFIFHILYIQYIHSFNHNSFIRLHSLKPLHFFIACMLSGEDLPVVPSRESNSGLPYSKPTRCQLSHAAPNNYVYPKFSGFITVLAVRSGSVARVDPEFLKGLKKSFRIMLRIQGTSKTRIPADPDPKHWFCIKVEKRLG
jgi:hypothetical protein